MPMHTSLRDGAEKNVEYGEIAQLARARGSYPRCRGFESPSRYFFMQIWNVKMAESLLHSFFYLKLFHFLFY